jgi:hypothetical protein
MYWLTGGIAVAEQESMNRAGLKLGAEVLDIPIEDLGIQRISAPMLQKWRLWRVDDQMIPPRAVSIPTRDERAVVVTWESGLADLLPDEAVPQTPGAAVSLLELFVAMTRPYAILLRSATDIPGIDGRDAQQLTVSPPRVSRKGANLAVETQLWEDGVLYKAEFQITRHRIIPHLSVLRKPVGVAISVE